MSKAGRRFKRTDAERRKEALIDATLTLMAKGGPEATTIRAIAKEAEVTQGLIRHYFSSKEELINAAYERHMANLMAMTCGIDFGDVRSAKRRLEMFVRAALMPPAVDPEAVSLWAGFIHMVKRDERMGATHERTYHQFRDHLEALISAALIESGKHADAASLRRQAIACNAVLDGLWLEGGALPDAFDAGELPAIGLASISAILNLPLGSMETET